MKKVFKHIFSCFCEQSIQVRISPNKEANKKLVGVDVFLDWAVEGRDPNYLSQSLEQIAGERFQLKMITNK